jgi:isocitrate lyase
MYTQKQIDDLQSQWENESRWKNVHRSYSAQDVVKMRGSLQIDYSLARLGADKFWKLLESTPFVRALGALTGNQAVQQVQAGLKAIYLSGWQVAADANDAFHTYPDQSLYPTLSVPHVLQRINNALIRADQIQHMENSEEVDWFVPIIADAEAGFGGPLNAFELVKSMIEAGAAGIHLEDQLSSLKKCGHMGGKVLVPTSEFIEKLSTSRFAADIMGISTIIIGRTDALSASLIRGELDPVDIPFLTGKRSHEGFHHVQGGLEYAIARARAFGSYCDMIWCETSKPDLGEAREFAQAIHEKFPKKYLAYNCSPSFNWGRHLDHKQLETFQDELGELGYKFQFVTLAGFHTLNASMFELAKEYTTNGMAAYSKFQTHEFELESKYGYKAIKHQRFVGAGYFDEILMALSDRKMSTSALKGSTEEAQFN